jgi:hypothetical protein
VFYCNCVRLKLILYASAESSLFLSNQSRKMFKFSTTLLTLAAALNGVDADGEAVQRNLRATMPSIGLGVAGNFAILSATGITDVYPSVVVGDVGTSPIGGTALLLACDEVIGNIYTVDAFGPACHTESASMLLTAMGDMSYAYNKAAQINLPDYLDLGAGLIGGRTLAPGLYKWTTNLLIASDIAIEGTGSTFDKWIFQVDGTMDLSSGIAMILSKGASAKNIVWQVADTITLGTTSHTEGIMLGKTGINMRTGATINGRLLAQTAVTLQSNTVVQPQL